MFRGRRSHCYGPVMTVLTANGYLQEAATFCRDGSAGGSAADQRACMLQLSAE